MKMLSLHVCVVAVFVSVVALAQQPAGPAVLERDRTFDFSKVRSYAWGGSHKAQDPTYDKIITAAIEAQLAAKGLTQASPADVDVAYHTVERVDVDLSSLDGQEPASGAVGAPAKMVHVGTLVIDLRHATTRKVLWRVSVEGVLEKMAPADTERFLTGKVASIFELYPRPAAPKKLGDL